MDRSREFEGHPSRTLRRVLILADESATWEVAGLRQLDRLALSLHTFGRDTRQPVSICVMWHPNVLPAHRWLPRDPRVVGSISDCDEVEANEAVDLIVSTRLLLFRDGLPQLLDSLPQPNERELESADSWEGYRSMFENGLGNTSHFEGRQPWRYLRNRRDLPAAERAFLRASGKSQDGLVARYVNRPLSRIVTRGLLRLAITPNIWSVLVFTLPIVACWLFLRGTYQSILSGCAIYQLYSILDGCDGEIARAKFMQTEFGRRLDSFLDLAGNILLALSLGSGLARQWERRHGSGWFYVVEGIVAAMFIGLSEGIVFARRTRSVNTSPSAKWNGALYQRHHEFLERSGILVVGERFAWWLVQLTKRDMAMLAFLLLAAFGYAEGILHLLLLVSGTSAVLAGNAFLRAPAPVLPQEAS